MYDHLLVQLIGAAVIFPGDRPLAKEPEDSWHESERQRSLRLQRCNAQYNTIFVSLSLTIVAMETNLNLMDKVLPALFFTLIVASTVMKFVDYFIDANHCKKKEKFLLH